MCGIAGVVLKEASRRVDKADLERMCAAMKYRGPDESGFWVDRHVGISMVRLSIIDLAGGSQPIHNEDKTVQIVFNGEIYNYKDLREGLEKKDHKFYTRTDTEAIIHLYEEYGEECVQHLRGMFAFAIWDSRKELLLLARDRLGIKPLHYYDDGKDFIFGSEIKSILSYPNVSRKMHAPSLVTYIAYGYVPDPGTMFEGIYKLPPGHILVRKNGGTKVKKYWDVQFNVEKVQPEEYYIERIIDILNEAVKMHLVSDVPLGAFLSGGTDSSVVVALMARNMAEPVKTFSIGFNNQQFDEIKYARKVAEQYGTDHHEEIVTPDAGNIIEKLVDLFDEPFADSSAIPTYCVSEITKKHVTVALSGDGGDELFGGYDRYRTSPIVRWAENIPLKLRKAAFPTLAKCLPDWFPGARTFEYLSEDADERYLNSISNGLSVAYPRVFTSDFCKEVATTDPTPIMWDHLTRVNGKGLVTRRQYLDLKTYLPGDILTKVDRTSMLVSLEARVPILDHHLVEFAATIPPELKVRGMDTKYLFKKVAERLLPHEVVYRPKMGFSIPLGGWIKKEWSEMSYDLVLGEKSLARNIFSRKFLRNAMTEHRWGRRDNSYVIWALMMLELWFREKIDKLPS